MAQESINFDKLFRLSEYANELERDISSDTKRLAQLTNDALFRQRKALTDSYNREIDELRQRYEREFQQCRENLDHEKEQVQTRLKKWNEILNRLREAQQTKKIPLSIIERNIRCYSRSDHHIKQIAQYILEEKLYIGASESDMTALANIIVYMHSEDANKFLFHAYADHITVLTDKLINSKLEPYFKKLYIELSQQLGYKETEIAGDYKDRKANNTLTSEFKRRFNLVIRLHQMRDKWLKNFDDHTESLQTELLDVNQNLTQERDELKLQLSNQAKELEQYKQIIDKLQIAASNTL